MSSSASTGRAAAPAAPSRLFVLVLCWLVVVFDGYDLIVYGAVVPKLLVEPGWGLSPATAGTINNQIGNIVDGDTNGVFYPGGGVEFNAGIFGIRVEAGDEIMFLNNGHTNNFRATAGPQIRF